MESDTQIGRARHAARIAGLWYLLLAATGIFSYQYLPTLVVTGDTAATVSRILASETLFRVGIVIELASAVVSLLLVMALYRLLSGVNRGVASLMVGLVIASVPISFVNVLNEIAALVFIHGSSALSAFSQSQLDGLAMVFLGLHSQGLYVIDIFWGLWLFPFGFLVYKSGFLPKILGILLFVNGFAYLGISFVGLVMPPYIALVSQVLLPPQAIGELSVMGWLLIKGVRDSADAAVRFPMQRVGMEGSGES